MYVTRQLKVVGSLW